jgi:hypothetical protein
MSEFGNRDPRAPRTRWIIVTTEADNARMSYGPWYDAEKAIKHAAQLREKSFRYTANPRHRDFEVDMVALDRWPGIRKATAF